MYIRKLQKEDVSPDSDFIRILSQLSMPDSKGQCLDLLWSEYERQANTHVIVAVDNGLGLPRSPWRVIGTGSIFIEQKFLRNGGIVGHIEDVVVDKEARTTGVGRKITNNLVDIAKANSCYKVILNCSDDNVPFYNKCGFHWSGREMRMNLD